MDEKSLADQWAKELSDSAPSLTEHASLDAELVDDQPELPPLDLNAEPDEIELAYQKALSAMEDLPWEDPAASAVVVETDSPEAPNDSTSANLAPALEVPALKEGEAEPVHVSGESLPDSGASDSGHSEKSVAVAGSVVAPSVDVGSAQVPVVAGPRLARGTERPTHTAPEELPNVTPAQVIEAALFVGGGPLSAKKIAAMLRGSFDAAAVEAAIDELNQQYALEGRPYEIRLGDGGYRLDLRPEFEKLRNRTYGAGPREVRLSQDILEVLALVAYRQPISQEELESHGKENAGNLVRQLIRRDLVSIQRGDGGRKDVKYLTTPRFLSVFGLGSLAELPEPDDLARK